jgi:flagellar motor switch protein FliG
MIDPGEVPDATLKATALLIAMGRPLAQRLVAKLNEEELRLVSRSAKTLPPMNRSVVEALVEEFARSFVDQVANTTPDAEIDAILNEGLGADAAGRLFTPVQPDAPKVLWPEIGKAEPKRLAEALAGQSDALIAAALSKLVPQAASQTLSLLPQASRAGVTRCLLDLGPVSPMALRVVETELYATLNAVDPKVHENQNRKRVAALLNGLGRESARDVLDTLSKDDEAGASAIKALLFDFEDVSRLDQASRVALFDTINPEQIILALSGANSSLTEIILSALGARGRRMVEAELQAKTKMPDEKISQARRLIADAALTLAETGRIALPQAQDGP